MRRIVLLIIVAFPAAVQADILHLRDGSRQHGELVSQDEQQIVFRVVLADGVSELVQTFPAALVARVERTGRRDRQPADRTGAETAAATESAAENYEQMLRRGFELLDDGDLRPALRVLQRVVLRAPALDRLDQQCRDARALPLDELLATTRIRVAAQFHGGRAFKLTYATPYERAALGRLLKRYQRFLLEQAYAGRSIAEWVAARAEYTRLRPDSRRLAADASRAAAVVGARLRFDPALRDDREQRRVLTLLRADLARLAAQVMALRGYTTPHPDDDPGDPSARLLKALSPPNVATKIENDSVSARPARLVEVTVDRPDASPQTDEDRDHGEHD